MSEYITTYTGIHFKPTEPEPAHEVFSGISFGMICQKVFLW